ncbi:MAG: amidophosphoribosyltransferase [Myxococcales bacterium]|nr:amidophosphoribosyltransferase [Myxococcales bacterium]
MCGVFGVWGHPEAANLTYLGLHALQHRGQESAGIASTDRERLYAHRVMGLVQAGFSSRELGELKGDAAIGHVRYSTAGTSHLKNAQPLAVDYASGSIALGHNGNLTNHDALRAELEAAGSIFQSGTDTETIIHLFARSKMAGVEDRLVDALRKVEGAYSLLLLSERKMIAVRDPMGIRPLVLGKMRRGDREVALVASEPTSFDLIGGEMVRDVRPGEVLVFDDEGMRSFFPFEQKTRAMCLFEYVYFARPDANLEGASVYEVRKELGRRLAEEHPLPAGADDGIVVPVPDSGVPAAIGFAEASGLSFQMGLIRSHYVGRTFIEPQDSIRHFGVRLKLNPNRAVLQNKRVIVVDDSVVRGTTSRKIVKMIRDAGAKEVHVRVSSPPTKWPCFYGIATPTREELIASSQSTAEITAYLEADSVGYLSLGALTGACDTVQGVPSRQSKYCHACFSGEYPVPIPSAPAHRLRLVG